MSTSQQKIMNYTFGPIPSRRFGMSLGIDLSPSAKQCNFDCLYCELDPAKTVDHQTQIENVDDIFIQVQQALKKHPDLDVITFTANGEPTLYLYLNDLIDKIDTIKGKIKTLILSNGANIYEKEVQETLSKIDIVKLSLDCVSHKCFKKLDRAHKSVQTEKIVDGIIEFQKIYHPTLIIEILFVKNMNDNEEEIALLKDALDKINPHRIDIGTIDRPPAYDVKPLNYNELEKIADQFQNHHVTIAYKNRPKAINNYTQEEILSLLQRRPLTQEDIENTFSESSKKTLQKLIEQKKITLLNNANVNFYKFIQKV